jgi:N-acetylglucosamine kinase-like BadF-type ATPase
MKLIADSGSTKTDWYITSKEGAVKKISTHGINPFYQTISEIVTSLEKDFPNIEGDIEEIFFYGAGCANKEKCTVVKNAICEYFNIEKVLVASDLLGAARSLCQEKEGIACILGTGSNSCHYKAGEIVKNVSPLGYKLGDEGSGAVIGEKLVSNVLKKQLSAATIEMFFERYKITPSEIIDNVYRTTFPNKYLAQFTKFIADNIHIAELENIVLFCFEEFVRRNLLQYDGLYYLTTYYTGSVGYHFKEQLIKTAEKNKLIVGGITKSPMEGLIKYHNHVK